MYVFSVVNFNLATESTYIFQSRFHKQTDGCAMGGTKGLDISKKDVSKHKRKDES